MMILCLLLLLLQGTLTLPPEGCREMRRILETCDLMEHCEQLEEHEADYMVLQALTALF